MTERPLRTSCRPTWWIADRSLNRSRIRRRGGGAAGR